LQMYLPSWFCLQQGSVNYLHHSFGIGNNG
jgi:hypothetical protein